MQLKEADSSPKCNNVQPHERDFHIDEPWKETLNPDKLILRLFGLNRQGSVWYCTKSLFRNQLAGFPADAIHFILNPYLGILEMLYQFLLT